MFSQIMFSRKRYWAIHSSALKGGRVSKIFGHHLIEGIPLISKQELNTALKSPMKKVVEREVEDLKKFGLIVSPFEFILLLSKYKARVIIDKDSIEKRLKIRNIKYIDISQILSVLKRNYLRGEKVRARIVYRNVGYTDDCTKVIVQDGTFNEDDIVECWVTQILESPSTKTLFCKMSRENG